MDGLADLSLPLRTRSLSGVVPAERTLGAPIGCVGVGLHSGQRVQLQFCPAPAGAGIVFRRTDLGMDIPARFDNVSDTRLCTVLSSGGASVGTVEHVLAALAGTGVTSAVVEVDGPEVPVLDGSAAPFVFLLECAGIVDLHAPARTVEVLRTVRVSAGDAWAELSPGRRDGLDMELCIEFAAGAIGRQSLRYAGDESAFRHELATARTFTLREEVEALQAAGLGRGGSLQNAVVVDGATVLNPGGLRMQDEFVRHKMLDAVGDLSLAGGVLSGSFRGHKSGHALNNRLLRALFADNANWRDAGAPALDGWAALPLPATVFQA